MEIMLMLLISLNRVFEVDLAIDSRFFSIFTSIIVFYSSAVLAFPHLNLSSCFLLFLLDDLNFYSCLILYLFV